MSIGKRVAAAGLAVVTILLGFWAGRTTMTPPAQVMDVPNDAVLTKVTLASVGRTYTWAVQAQQPRTPVAFNALSGVVTGVSKSGVFKVGQVAYRVNAVPVRVVHGATPFYRRLTVGDSGQDVAQLNRALVSLGFQRAAPSSYTRATASAVRRWQSALKMPRTGVVENGELVAVSTLPAALFIDTAKAQLAALLTGGEPIISTRSGVPVFVMTISSDQAKMAPTTSQLVVHFKEHSWPAVVADTATTTDGLTTWTLKSPTGGSVCGSVCTALPTAGESTLLVDVQVVPPAKGPALPVAAILTRVDGSTVVFVVDAAGGRSERLVTVKGSQDGVAVVDGVAVGEQVQVIAGAATATTQSVSPSPSVSRTP